MELASRIEAAIRQVIEEEGLYVDEDAIYEATKIVVNSTE